MKQDSSNTFARDIRTAIIVSVLAIFFAGFICARIIG